MGLLISLWLVLFENRRRDPRVGKLECLILNQRRLHKRVDCVRRPSQSILDWASGIRVAGVLLSAP
jgi:hypothetical protein